jgi:hypothetical protein
MTATTTLHPYALAALAGVACPDSPSSPGGRWLQGIAEHVAERRHDGDDLAHEIADSAVPPYTSEVWQIFVDLALWHEDVSDYAAEGDDLTRRASLALYVVAERLADALLAGEV